MNLQVSRLNYSAPSQKKILTDVSFQVANGEILGILGSSGSGKTTLLQLIAGLLTPDSGQIWHNQKELTKIRTEKRKVGLAFQNPTLFARSVRENVEFGIDDLRTPPQRRNQLAEIMMSAMNIAGLSQRLATTLSGGQAQRVSLARTLAAEPEILLLDEPLAHIELAIRHSIHLDLLNQIHRRRIPTLYVTHDLEDACAVADRIAVLDQGRIIQIGTPPELFFQPNSLAVATIMGIPNSFAVQVAKCSKSGREQQLENLAGSSKTAPTDFCQVTLGRTPYLFQTKKAFTGAGIAFIAPNNITLTASKNTSVFALTGKILRRTFARSHWSYQIETEFGTTVAWQLEIFQPGDYVDLEFLNGWVIPTPYA